MPRYGRRRESLDGGRHSTSCSSARKAAAAGEIHLSLCHTTWVAMSISGPAQRTALIRLPVNRSATATSGSKAKPMSSETHSLMASTLENSMMFVGRMFMRESSWSSFLRYAQPTSVTRSVWPSRSRGSTLFLDPNGSLGPTFGPQAERFEAFLRKRISHAYYEIELARLD